jgi:hypothetical protein
MMEKFKKIIVILIAATLAFFTAQAQALKADTVPANSTKSTIPEFTNQREQENYQAKELFDKPHGKQQYERYKGQIIINGNSYRYDDKVLRVYATAELQAIFKKGIFYPDIMTQSFKYKPKIKIRLMNETASAVQKKETSKAKQIAFYNLKRTDTLVISNLEELKSIKSTPKQKKFRFWLQGQYPIANPVIYFIELANSEATSATDMLTFIDGATLTFFEEGWVII